MGQPGVECICHLYCSEGSEPRDCSTQIYNYSGKLGYPVGKHTHAESEGDDVLHQMRYCSTHGKYIDRDAVFIEIDWKEFYKNRLPESQRLR